jgi:hypothetical protein
MIGDLRIRFEVESLRSSRWLRLLGPRSDPHHLVAAAPEFVLERKHSPVFVERPTPRDNLIQCEH